MNQNNIIISGRQMVSLTAEPGHILHRIGSNDYTPNSQMTVKPEDVVNIEEVSVEDVPTMTDAEYSRRVVKKIRERYSVDDELALVNNMLSDSPTAEHRAEYAIYQAYREVCKTEARQNV